MVSDTVAGREAASGNVMGSVESGPTDRFVVADVTRDGAYLTIPLAEAASLPAWR
jgi:hypothetical protein